MAYSNFTLPDVLRQFALTVRPGEDLFARVPPVPVDPTLRRQLDEATDLATLINTEKARSEMLIAPVLMELWRRGRPDLCLYSGVDMVADPDAGLTGFCDFLVGRGPQLNYVVAPLLAVVEAKNESIPGGFGQCAAELVGIRRFNEREGRPVEPVYGAVTTGELWRFLRLAGSELTVDAAQHTTLADVDRILGILLHVVGLNPVPATTG